MNAQAEFFGREGLSTTTLDGQRVEACPICEGFGFVDKDQECPYCDHGLITPLNHGWVILAAEIAGDIPLDFNE